MIRSVCSFLLMLTAIRVLGAGQGLMPPTRPEVFLDGVVSGDQHDFVVRFPPGRTDEFWLMRSDAEYRTSIHRIVRSGAVWREAGPAAIPYAGPVAYPFFSTDGQRLFFDGMDGDGAPDIWAADRRRDGWSPPVRLGPEVNSPAVEMLGCAAANGNLYFSSNRPGGLGQFDIYRARRTPSGYAPAENLGPAVNTTEFEAHPYIAPDESYLLFDARRKSGSGSNDIYVARRTPTGDFGQARPLPSGINSAAGDMRPSVSPDGRILFFCSDRRGTQDIWWVDAAVVPGVAR